MPRPTPSIHPPPAAPPPRPRGPGDGAVLLAVLLVAGLLLLPVGPSERTLGALQDLAHLPLGGALALALAAWTSRRVPWALAANVLAVLLAAALLLGFEFFQPLVGREFAWRDATAGALGAAGTVLVLRRPMGRGAVASLLLGALLLALGAREGALDLVDAWRQRQAFPLLASFEDDLELRRIEARDATVERAEGFATDGRSSLRVQLAQARWPAVTLVAVPSDWRAYEALAFDVHVDGGGSLPLVLKVVDRDHDERYEDRYQETFVLHAGPNHVEVPLGRIASAPSTRRMDLGAVDAVQWFVDGLTQSRTIHLDAVRLVSAAR